MVALIGCHTIGVARCINFRERIYGDFGSNFDPASAMHLNNLKSICPIAGGGDDNISPLDYVTPTLFDNSFYQSLLRNEGLLNSDQELYSSILGVQTKDLVTKYASDPLAFFQQFAESMVNMGNIMNPDTFANGEVRKNCRFVN
uniref:peroxidase n=1 Tax=Rhizophora mucronata TaxID=61149 RepID=A0A2P2P373_RHIMU